mmetsp:Transcript_30734/g.70481  ORF Transcript_30734/g.70481 Transcript_30734/m.70481 type:complete len:215 (-) Transcript_30734:750-1394(-)
MRPRILPTSACHVCSTRIFRTSPLRMPAWTAAPRATACMGSTVRLGSTPKRFLTSFRTATIFDAPPTITIWSTGAPMGSGFCEPIGLSILARRLRVGFFLKPFTSCSPGNETPAVRATSYNGVLSRRSNGSQILSSWARESSTSKACEILLASTRFHAMRKGWPSSRTASFVAHGSDTITHFNTDSCFFAASAASRICRIAVLFEWRECPRASA